MCGPSIRYEITVMCCWLLLVAHVLSRLWQRWSGCSTKCCVNYNVQKIPEYPHVLACHADVKVSLSYFHFLFPADVFSMYKV